MSTYFVVYGAGLKHGQVTIGTTAQRLQAVPADKEDRRTDGGGIVLKASSGNTGIVYVGNADVSDGNGFFLSSGEAINLPVDDPSRIYLVASESGQIVAWIGL